MTEDTNMDAESADEQGLDSETLAVKSTYKILGEFEASDGAGVLGKNKADGSGTPIGVQGTVTNDDGYGLATPDDARIGKAIESPGGHTLTVDGSSALTLEPRVTDYINDLAGSAVVAGYSVNTVNDHAGATISGGGKEGTTEVNGNERVNTNGVFGDYGAIGGGYNNRAGRTATVGGGKENTASGSDSTVGGGEKNTASERESTVGGGRGNTASGIKSTVGGGENNIAIGKSSTVGGGGGNRTGKSGTSKGGYATVPGGQDNVAREYWSFAAGRKAKATDQGSFVWSDSRDHAFSSSGLNQFVVEAAGGVGLGTNKPYAQLQVSSAAAADATDNPRDHVTLIENTADDLSGVDATNANALAIKSGPSSNPGTSVNFINFYDGDGDSCGRVHGDGSGGFTLSGNGSDYAEYMPRRDPDEEIEAGDVVGVVGDAVTKETAEAEGAMVVSNQPIVTGNSPGPEPEDRDDHETVAFVGQVPAKVRGPVEPGDLIVPSGGSDGTAIAVSPSDWQPGDGPLVGRAWEGDGSEAVTEVTVAVGVDDPTVLGDRLAAYRERIDDLEADTEHLRRELDRKDDRIADLEERLAALESQTATAKQADD